MSAERAPRRADCLAEMSPVGERGREGGGAHFFTGCPPTVNERALIARHRPRGVTGVSTQHVLLSLAARARAERDEVVHEVGLGASCGGYIVVVKGAHTAHPYATDTSASQRRPRAWGPPT